jgi:hypothetical protein
MKYYSTNKNSDQASFKEATIRDKHQIKDFIFQKQFRKQIKD